MADSSSGRDSKTNSGSDSAVHHRGTAAEQFDSKTIAGATPTTGANGQTVRDERPSPIPGSAVR